MSILAIPATFASFVDDAATFPPGSSPLRSAVQAHAEHRRSPHRDFVGPFIIGAADLARLDVLVTADDFPAGVEASVVAPSAAEVAHVVAMVSELEHVRLVGLEVKLDSTQSPGDQIGMIARDAPAHVTTFVEAPRPHEATWPEVIDAVALHQLTLKLRTGGTEAAAFPTDLDVATWIRDAVGQDVPFKCTAGLHNAVRHTSAETGFEHHGYLNILAATWLASTGADLSEIAGVIAERDAAGLSAAVADNPRISTARRWFTSYGSCSVQEPLDDLTALGLITRTTTEGLP